MRSLAVLVMILFCANAWTADGVYENEDAAQQGKHLAGSMMDACATVTGANYLDDKCNFLTKDASLKAQFEDHVKFCAAKLVTVIGAPKEMVQKMDAAAKDVANSHECTPEAKSIVLSGFNMSVRLWRALTQLQQKMPQDHTLLGN